MAERHEQMKLSGRKPAAIGRTEKKNTECFFFCLKTDRRYCVQFLLQRELTEAMERFFAFKSFPQRVAMQIAEDGESAETHDEFDEMIVKTFLLRSAAKCVAESDRNDGGWSFWIAVMNKQSAARNLNDVQNAIESLRQHALHFAADYAGGRKIQIGKREHVTFDAPLFFFVKRHGHEHGDKHDRDHGHDRETCLSGEGKLFGKFIRQ